MERSDIELRTRELGDLDVEPVVPAGVVRDTSPRLETPSVRRGPAPSVGGTVLRVGLGVAALVVAIGVMTGTPAEYRVALGLVGAALVVSGFDRVLKRYVGPRVQTALVLSVVWLLLVALAAVFASFLPLSEARNPANTFTQPVLAAPDLFSRHPFGTDRQGLDILGGIIYGFRVSLVVGVGAVSIGLMLGGAVGVAAGYYRKTADRVIDIFTNSMLAFPPLILLMGVAAVLPRNTRNITLALAIISIPTYVRLARANTMVVAQREFVLAARVLGAKNRRIIFRDIIPSVIVPLLSYAFVIVAVVIVAEASLSFLGLSIPRPQPTLGNMIAAGQDQFQQHPHLVFIPASALFLTVLALNRLGEAARRRLDPREAKI